MSTAAPCLVCSPLPGTEDAIPRIVCRACTLFFKRTESRGSLLPCRGGNNACILSSKTERNYCKRCRYMKCLQHFSYHLGNTPSTSSGATSADSKIVMSSEIALSDDNSSEYAFTMPNPGHPNAILSIGRILLNRGDIFMLRKLHQNYRVMCTTRLTNETMTLSPSGATLPWAHTTHESLNVIHQIAAGALFSFANQLLEDYADISTEETWSLIRASQLCLLICEGCYRTEQKLPDKPNVLLVSFIGYMVIDELEKYFADVPNKEWIREAVILMRKHMTTILRMRTRLKAVAMDEMEFVALVGLIFWGNRAIDAYSERVAMIAERARNRLFHELHFYYRDGLHLVDYAGRLGRLMQLLESFQECELEIAKDMEIFRLFDIFTDDCFTYQFCAKQRRLR